MRYEKSERELGMILNKTNKEVISINTSIDWDTMDEIKNMIGDDDILAEYPGLKYFVFRDNMGYFGCAIEEVPDPYITGDYDSSKILGLHWGESGTLTIGHVSKAMKGAVYGLGKYQVLQVLDEIQSFIALEVELNLWDEYELLKTS